MDGGLFKATRLGGALLAVVLVLGGALALVVRYTPLLEDGLAAPPGVLESMDRRFHHGAPPCLRYPKEPLASSVTEAATALAVAGLGSRDLSELIGDLYARAASREWPLHSKEEVDEYLDALSEAGGPRVRVAMALKRDRLRARLANVLATPVKPVRLVSSLAPEQRAELERQWDRDPAVFVLPGLLALTRELKVLATDRRLDQVKAALEAKVAAGEVPTRLSQLGLPSHDLEDEWGAPFILDATLAELTVRSLGRDGSKGGTDDAADRQRTVSTSGRPIPSTTGGADCIMVVSAKVKRTELDAALADTTSLAATVRLVPAYKDGVPTGFRLFGLRTGSLVQRVGLCEGDVVHTVNGLPITSPDQALEVYSSLKGARRVELAVTRRGEAKAVVVELE